MFVAKNTPPTKQEVAQSGAAIGRGRVANSPATLPEGWRPAQFPLRQLSAIEALDHNLQVAAYKEPGSGRWAYTFPSRDSLSVLKNAMWAGAVISHHMQAPDGRTALVVRLPRHQKDWKGVEASRRLWEGQSRLLRAMMSTNDLARLQRPVRARKEHI